MIESRTAMNRLPVLAFTAFAICAASVAQEFQELKKCTDTAMTQHAMHVCASEEARRVDADLAAVYKQLRSAVEKQPGGIEKVRSLEKAWAAYRNAYIEAAYPAEDKQAEYGSIFPTEANLLYADLAREQIKAAKGLLKHHTAPKP
jgi:uncharacterized protein YecT (DUF1311 family)